MTRTQQRGMFPALDPDTLAQQRRDEQARAAAQWTAEAARVLARLILSGQQFDAYTLTEQGLPDPPRRALMAGLITDARRAGHIRLTGYAPSRRPTSGSVARWWTGTDTGRAHARALLETDEQ